jgi:hypothetical protein
MGPAGPPGAPGPQGVDGSYTVVETTTTHVLPDSTDFTNTQVIYNNSSAVYSLLGSANISGTISSSNLSNVTTISSFTPTIYTTAYDATNKYLYIGGNFKYVGNTLCNGIAYYDFTLKTWNAITRTSGVQHIPVLVQQELQVQYFQ